MGNAFFNSEFAPGNGERTPSHTQWDRVDALHGIANLADGCNHYYAAKLSPIRKRLTWIVLFPDDCPEASRNECIAIARRIIHLTEDQHRPCSEHDTLTLRAVWARVIHECPHEDIRNAMERADTAALAPHRQSRMAAREGIPAWNPPTAAAGERWGRR